MAFARYVALGDSFTEGVGDNDETRPNGVRGWADRFAEALAAQNPDFGYANLAIRGRKLRAIIAEQLEPALALQPDLVTLYAGGNDIMRPSVDIDALMSDYDAAVGRLAASGATVVLFTAFDPGGSAIYRPLRGRFALLSEGVRWIADNHDATIVDFWRMRELRDWRYWDADRMHLGTAGHTHMARRVAETLGVPHRIADPELGEDRQLGRREQWSENADWAKSFLAPWVHRRVTGRSSGDHVSAKRPTLEPISQV